MAAEAATEPESARLEVDDLVPLSEAALERFDAATITHEFDDSLLQATPARDLTQRLNSLVAALRDLDAERVLKRQGWWSRLTGADLEARLQFESACRTLNETMQRTKEAAEAARRAGSLIWRTRAALLADSERLDHALGVAEQARKQAGQADPDLRARFERRLVNLAALQASSQLTLVQLDLAVTQLRGLLDRHGEVERLIMPLWRHHAVSAAQGAAAADRDNLASFADLRSSVLGGAETLIQGHHP